jgi:hypothetical protein
MSSANQGEKCFMECSPGVAMNSSFCFRNFMELFPTSTLGGSNLASGAEHFHYELLVSAFSFGWC